MSDETPSQKTPGFFDANPKMLFVFGLVSGVAVTLLLNSVTLPAKGETGDTPVVKNTDTTDTADTGSAVLAAVTSNDHIYGDISKAKVVLVEYSDFECPYCERHQATIQSILEEYGSDVALVYRHFPLTSIHPEAVPSALASECAGEQGKFFEYADELYANQTTLGDELYTQIATDLKLDLTKFAACYADATYQSVVDGDLQSGIDAGVEGTPATFVNGIAMSGAIPFESFQQVIDAELAK
ncbi:MAG: thioredoxin domain-containing protein [Patescibacteria group bacterium]|jgi:protein-disulfide isomerase